MTNLLEAGQLSPEAAEEYLMIGAMDDAAFESWLEAWLVSHGVTGGRYTRPHFFDDSAFNAPLQPVVGVCWHEARAYCAWLSAQTDRTYRLPTEHEWDAAARGQARRPLAYDGPFDPAKGNTYETRLQRTTPAGVFPEGDTPEGISDLAANSSDWTSSPWVPEAVPEASDAGGLFGDCGVPRAAGGLRRELDNGSGLRVLRESHARRARMAQPRHRVSRGVYLADPVIGRRRGADH